MAGTTSSVSKTALEVNRIDAVMPKPIDPPLKELLNLGPKSAQWLREVGICTIADVRSWGAVVTYRLVKQRQPKASLNLLWALAAGLKGKDWRSLSAEEKSQLKREAEAE